jgi:hypothetical protein
VSDLFADDQRFDEAYDEYEAITAMSYAQEASVRKFPLWFPAGRLVWRDRHSPERSLVARLAKQVEVQGDQWRYVVAGLFPSGARAAELLAGLQTAIARRGAY